MPRLTLKELKVDLDHLTAWTHLHDEEHNTDADRMNTILLLLAERERDQSTHDNNHHGLASTIKKDGLLVTAVSLLYGAIELFRSGGFTFPF